MWIMINVSLNFLKYSFASLLLKQGLLIFFSVRKRRIVWRLVPICNFCFSCCLTSGWVILWGDEEIKYFSQLSKRCQDRWFVLHRIMQQVALMNRKNALITLETKLVYFCWPAALCQQLMMTLFLNNSKYSFCR